jgi:flavin reductase (DIM6/NTAB) family NADH-FMN oxidoreductase RutF
MKWNTSKILNVLLALSLVILIIRMSSTENGDRNQVTESTLTDSLSVTDHKTKRSINRKLVSGAKPAMVIGSYSPDYVPNIMTASWYGICNSNPPMVAVSMRPATLSYHHVTHHMAFTVNIPSRDFVFETDFAGQNSGRDVQKFSHLGLTPVKAEFVEAPYVDEFPVILECRVVEYHDLGSHRQFIGEVIDVKASIQVIDENERFLMDVLKPIQMGEDGYYYVTGERLERGYNTKLKK